MQPAPKFAFVQQRHLLSWPLRWNVHAMGIPELWEFPDLIVFRTLENPFPKSSVWESHTLLLLTAEGGGAGGFAGEHVELGLGLHHHSSSNRPALYSTYLGICTISY